MADLVVAHADQEPNPEIFGALDGALDALEDVPEEAVVSACLSGAWGIVGAFGFAPELDACIRCGTPLGGDEVGRFDLAAGGILCPECAEGTDGPRVGPIARGQLRSLLEGRWSDAVTHARQHLALLSDFVAFHVVPRPLKSFRFLADVLPPEEER
jgi:recombinational DNA repair protein (RecF pathway)